MTIRPGDIYLTRHVHAGQTPTDVVISTVVHNTVWAIHLDAYGNRGLPVEPMLVSAFLANYTPRPKVGPPSCSECGGADPYLPAGGICGPCKRWRAVLSQPVEEAPPATEKMPPRPLVAHLDSRCAPAPAAAGVRFYGPPPATVAPGSLRTGKAPILRCAPCSVALKSGATP